MEIHGDHKIHIYTQNIFKYNLLRESDVMIISSDKERSSFLNQYRDNPEILMEKKIIFILSRQDRYPCITVRVNNWEILLLS